MLGGINLVDVARSELMYAAAMPGRLCSADAIQLATVIRLQTDPLGAYGVDLMAAVPEAGLSTESPGTGPSPMVWER